jgi:hypothetical protein
MSFQIMNHHSGLPAGRTGDDSVLPFIPCTPDGAGVDPEIGETMDHVSITAPCTHEVPAPAFSGPQIA